MKTLIIFSAIILSCIARSPYAGRRPVGYPYLEPVTANTATSALFGDRLGGDSSTTTTRLPLEALGNAELVNTLKKLPTDNQPFWLLNWRALENQRRNPKTYPQSVNNFIDNSV